MKEADAAEESVQRNEEESKGTKRKGEDIEEFEDMLNDSSKHVRTAASSSMDVGMLYSVTGNWQQAQDLYDWSTKVTGKIN